MKTKKLTSKELQNISGGGTPIPFPSENPPGYEFDLKNVNDKGFIRDILPKNYFYLIP